LSCTQERQTCSWSATCSRTPRVACSPALCARSAAPFKLRALSGLCG
jgi:hypothetical protein